MYSSFRQLLCGKCGKNHPRKKTACRYLINPNKYTPWHHLGEIHQHYHIYLSLVWFDPHNKKHQKTTTSMIPQRFGNAKGLPNTSLFSASASCGSSATLPAPEEGPQLKVKSPDPVGEGQRLVAVQHLKRSDFANEKTLRKFVIFLTPFQKKGICQLNWKVQGESCFYVFFKASCCCKRSCFPKSQRKKQDQPATDWEWWFG